MSTNTNPPMYAQIAVNTMVHMTFTYEVPPSLAGELRVGHLVRVPFRTATMPGVVVGLSETSDIPETKAIEALIDPHPVISQAHMDAAFWISENYLAPIGPCIWLWIPTGLAGHRDVRLTLLKPDYKPAGETAQDKAEAEVVALLKRRGALRYRQQMRPSIGRKVSKTTLEKAIRRLIQEDVLESRSMLTPPRVKPQTIDTVQLAISPENIPEVLRYLGKRSRRADLLEAVADMTTEDAPDVELHDVIEAAGSTRATLNKLASEEGLIEIEDGFVRLAIPHDAVDENLVVLRRGQVQHHVLRVLAREEDPVDVSWIYAQTGAKLDDLKALDALELVNFGEKQTWRDSLAERDFEPTKHPPLTGDQQAVWERVRDALRRDSDPTRAQTIKAADADPTLASPLAINGVDGEGTRHVKKENIPISNDRYKIDPQNFDVIEGKRQLNQGQTPPPNSGEDGRGFNYRKWQTPAHLWAKIKELTQEKRRQPTKAEELLWDRLKGKQFDGIKFRRQHSIDRFIVDFYCHDAELIIEVDGEIHQYQPEEDALRQEFLESLGYQVLRFTNAQVFTTIEAVLSEIAEVVRTRKADPTPTLPVDGEGVPSGKKTEKPLAEDSTVNSEISYAVKGEIHITEERVPSPPTPFMARGEARVGSRSFLLHGVTGSGKTEIYLRAIDEVLAQGRQAIFLVPEIALTAQTVRRVASRFATRYPGKVAVVHSGLSEGERFDTWRRAREGRLKVVVGARSALFVPFPDTGIIVIDEEHDPSYKNIQTPAYDVRQVAEYLMRTNQGALLLGSATPSLEVYTRAKRTDGDLFYLHLPERIMGHRERIHQQETREGIEARYKLVSDDAMTIDLPPVEVVDMRIELKRGNTTMFSTALDEAIQAALGRREQIILLLNRRGTSSYVFCRDCGYVATSPETDLPLTFHHTRNTLMDHHSGKSYPIPSVCPACSSKRIKYFGAGTQQVEAEIEKRYPAARLVRWDRDTANKPDMHDAILSRFMNHEADIMVGTQMIAKGLDLPLVTLVGVVSADVGLGLPDFRAAERTFQLLTQVAGRAGRGLLGGQVILQTYRPEHYVIQAAAEHDVDGFYAQELEYRREMGYPPFRRMARILFRDKNEARARSDAEQAAAILRKVIAKHELTATELIGPAPCFFAKLSDQYRWHVLIRSPDPLHLLSLTHSAVKWHIDIDPLDVL